MVTREEWAEYQEYRANQRKKQIDYINFNSPKPKREKRMFLFWEWETIVLEPSIKNLKPYFLTINSLAESGYPIPPETIEGCLNWLIERDKRG